MDASALCAYVDQIYAYALGKTFSRREADELAQEIMLTAVQKWPTLRDPSLVGPWLFGIARNQTKVFRRYMGK